MLNLPEVDPALILDVDCGYGMDTEQAMLDVAMDRVVEADVLLGDMGQGVPFRAGMFDGCISIFSGYAMPIKRATTRQNDYMPSLRCYMYG